MLTDGYNIRQVRSMINIAVVDDEPIFIDTLINKIADCCSSLGIEYLVDKYSNGYNILENYTKYHLVFLDIEMPSIDGIATAKRINDLKGTAEIPLIIFVTSHDEFVFDALKSFPYSFIRKSDIDDETSFSEIMIKVSKAIDNNCKTINIRTNRQDVVLKIADIVFIEKYKNYSYIHTKSEKYPVKSSLMFYEEMLSDFGFIRCHEGYIVNLNNISKIFDKAILLTNNETVPMSRNKCKMVKEAFVKRTVCYNVY